MNVPIEEYKNITAKGMKLNSNQSMTGLKKECVKTIIERKRSKPVLLHPLEKNGAVNSMGMLPPIEKKQIV